MKNILFLINNLNKGGAERVVSILIKYFFMKKNVNIYLMLLEDGISYDLPENFRPIILYNKEKRSLRKLLELPFMAYKVAKFAKKHNIETIASFLYRSNYIAICSKIFGFQGKVVINIRQTTSRYLTEGLLGKINLFLLRTLFNKADLIISNSKGVDEDLKSIMKITTETEVIYNPLDIKYINNKKYICEDVEFNFNNDNKYIISVGRLIKQKRNQDLIQAFYEIQKNNNKLELIFLGDGVLKDSLIEKCINLEIINKVHFLGNVSNPFYYLNKSDLFVLTSQFEGFPNVLLEAMACGLPVISSDCKSGPREILGDNEYGLLYDVGDVNKLINCIKYYVYNNLDKDKIMKRNLKRVEDYNVDKAIQKFERVFGIE